MEQKTLAQNECHMINSKNKSETSVTPEVANPKISLGKGWNKGNIKVASSVIQTWPLQPSSNDLSFMVLIL